MRLLAYDQEAWAVFSSCGAYRHDTEGNIVPQGFGSGAVVTTLAVLGIISAYTQLNARVDP